MTLAHIVFRGFGYWALSSLWLYPLAYAQTTQPASTVTPVSSNRNGEHDFDFEIGTWATHIARLVHPLTGSKTWVQYDGTTLVHAVWGGRANLADLDVTGPSGRLQLASLRLYNPDSRKWSLNICSVKSGVLSPPTIGEFTGGRGEFYDQEIFDGRAILVRFVISEITADSVHVEQSFSDDWGKTWEVNWIATDTRLKGPHPQ
jgi:hypothetical protein